MCAELPIMRHQAWQRLASGGVTPSTTTNSVGNHSNGAVASNNFATQTEQAGSEVQKPQPALLVGLDIC